MATDAIDPATYFEDMAARIRRNPTEFQGAYVVVGPDMVTVINATFGPSKNIALFWSTVSNHVKIEADAAAAAADQASKDANVYGMRR